MENTNFSVFMFFLGLVIGIGGATTESISHYRDFAIENQCASYDVKTGEFIWNNHK